MFVSGQPGEGIDDMIREMSRVSRVLWVGLETEANGFTFLVTPDDEVETLLECWRMVAEGGRGTVVSAQTARKVAS